MFDVKKATPWALGSGCLFLVACSDGDPSGAGGASADDSSSGGQLGPSGGASSGGAQSGSGGSATGGEPAQGGEGGAPSGGSDGSGGSAATCTGQAALSFLGDFVAQDGRQHWLRRTATATTYAIIPGGAATPLALPELEVLAENCEERGFFVTRRAGDTFSRIDLQKEGPNVWLCRHADGFVSAQAAADAAPANAASLIQGCESGPWLGLTKVVAP